MEAFRLSGKSSPTPEASFTDGALRVGGVLDSNPSMGTLVPELTGTPRLEITEPEGTAFDGGFDEFLGPTAQR